MAQFWKFAQLPLAALVVFTAVVPAAHAATAILQTNIDRPLRYTPEGTDFVIVNSPEYFNRPLYTNTSFRVDGGDVPEFALYLPGRGGNLRLGVMTPAGAKWINSSAHIITRYRPGSLVYEISDPLVGATGSLMITAIPLEKGQGLIVRADTTGQPITLVWAYGGANGVRPSRDGDIGTGGQEPGQLFQLVPANCAGDSFSINGGEFSLSFQTGTTRGVAQYAVIHGVTPTGSKLAIANANQWNSIQNLLASAGQQVQLPVLVGQAPVASGAPIYLALQRIPQQGETTPELATYAEVNAAEPVVAAAAPTVPLTYADLAKTYLDAEAHRRSVADQVTADTPDPYINAAVSALCVAADGIWDEPTGVFEHGAVAWRTRLLGWRGPYSADELGWFDRAVRDFTYWAGQQNTAPAGMPPPPDPAANYARDEPALHSNGDLTKSHYDMNLVYIDAVFRHLLWTGDLDFARKEWPVIQRHLAWEQRLFRRPFSEGNMPLYEAYAAIWASDDLEYNGGGATHATAFNYFHNLMAARIAQLIGEDPTPYKTEADLILRAMRNELWLSNLGWYAENKDWVGLQMTHDSPALWTFYHTIDSQAATPFEAWQMSRFVDTQIAHIPIQGPGVPTGYATLPTTNWMPYTWSLNNVVMAETAQTSLAYWQANREEEAFKLFKGCLLDSMYLGLCPGNAGMTTYYDAYRGESQRDFGDGIGATSRALVEGLFGVHPDVLAGELLLHPGFPAEWTHAVFHHPAIDYSYHYDGQVNIQGTALKSTETGSDRATVITKRESTSVPGYAETYSITPKFSKPMSLRLQIVARRSQIASLSVNGQPVACTIVEDAVEVPRIEIVCPAAPRFDVHITWTGDLLAGPVAPPVAALGSDLQVALNKLIPREFKDPQGALNGYAVTATSFKASVVGTYGFRTVFLKVQQGDMRWWAPLSFEIRPAFEIIASTIQDAAHLRFTVRNNTTAALDREVVIQAGGVDTKTQLNIPAFGESSEIALDATGFLPGSISVAIDLGNKQFVNDVVTYWNRTVDPAKTHFEPVNLTAAFNDQLTQIFKNDYLSPRSPFTSLAIPKQGFGTWTNVTLTFNVNDRGLRAAADAGNGFFTTPQGVPFQTPGMAGGKNIIFTSQWDNYPRAATIPLAGKAAHAYLLMAGSTNPMQSRIDNGEVVVAYTDGSTLRLALENPTTWWPIDQDYFIDDFGFRRPDPLPPRVDLAAGTVRTLDMAEYLGRGNGAKSRGGEATVLDLPLDPAKELKSLTVHTLANDVVIGLMAVTLVR